MAVNDHLIALFSSKQFISTDDGVNWTDITAALSALGLTGGLNRWVAATSDGDRWLLLTNAGRWAVSTDSMNWTGSDYAQNPFDPPPGYGTWAWHALYVPPRTNPFPGSNRWIRWIVCGSVYDNGTSEFTGVLPRMAMVSLTSADTPLNAASTWAYIDLPASIAERPVSLFSIAHDPVNYNLWVFGVAHDTGNGVLLFADRNALERSGGAETIVFQDVSSHLPTKLRVGGFFASSAADSPGTPYPYTTSANGGDIYYDWKSQRLVLVTHVSSDTVINRSFAMRCGPLYNSYAWAQLGSFGPSVSWYNVEYDFYSTAAFTNHAKPVALGEPSLSHAYLVDGIPFEPQNPWHTDNMTVQDNYTGLRTAAGTFLRIAFFDDGVNYYWAQRRAAAAFNASTTWSDVFGTLVSGYMTRGGLVQAPSAAVSLATGVTLTHNASITWAAPNPAYYGEKFSLDGGSVTSAVWGLTDPAGVTFGVNTSDSVVLSEEYSGNQRVTEALTVTADFSPEAIDASIFIIRELVNFGVVSETRLTAHNALVDTLTLVDSMIIRWMLTLSDTVNVSPTLLEVPHLVAALVDILDVGITPLDEQTATEALADALALTTLLQFAPLALLSDEVALTTTLTDWHNAYLTIVDALVAAAVIDSPAHITAVMSDTVTVTPTLQTLIEATETLADSVQFVATFRIGDEIYKGYVFNPANRAASEYSNFEFNSLATVSGTTMLGSENGLYSLGGDTDDGTKIQSVVRTALMDIAQGRMAQVVSAYLGYTSDRTIVLKAVVTSPSGEKTEYWYRLVERTATDMREGRVKLGLGLKSVYWQFEICNAGGADFEIDALRLHRIVLDRRI